MCTTLDGNNLSWIVILGVETLIIVLGNTVTIIVFWKYRSQLKRTSYLLINLSVADLMVGVGNIETLVNKIWKFAKSSCNTSITWGEYVVLEEFFGVASITFLVLISLERLHAIVSPFRMRAMSTRKYMWAIVVVWILSGIIAALQLLQASSILITQVVFALFTSGYALVCLITICCAYTAIWYFSKKENPALPLDRQKRNKDLAKTLFIVTLLSLITWLPFIVINTVRHTFDIHADTRSVLVDVTRFLQLANSFINPIVYCFRMPMFRNTIKTMFARPKPKGFQIRGHKRCSEANAVVLLCVYNLHETAF
ncbi:adenosine receptor A3-like [Oculina patagonica]